MSKRKIKCSQVSDSEQLVQPISMCIELEDPFLPNIEPQCQQESGLLVQPISIKHPFIPASKRAKQDQHSTSSGTRSSDGSGGKSSDGSGNSSCSDNASNTEDIGIEEPFHGDSNIFGNNYMVEDDTSDCLYESSELSVNKTLAILFTWFCSSPSISKESFSRLLYLLHKFVLPTNNKLPCSYPQAQSAIGNLLVPLEEYDCCIKDCIIFRNCSEGSFESLTNCPKCGSERFHPHTSIARKKFKYIPLAPRIKRMFANRKVSELIQKHDGEHANNMTSISDLHQSDTWKSLYSVDGHFKGDPRGICLSLCTDGTNPFSKEKISYSMWPITLTILNLPFHIRNLPRSIVLAGIIPGKSEPQNIDPYIEILVDEIVSLNSLQCYDGYQEEYFDIKIDILFHILDYPGHNKLFHCVGAGAYAGCAYCTHRGEYCLNLQKMVYPRNRCFLQEDDTLRLDEHNFPDRKKDLSISPELKTTQYVAKANAEYSAAVTNVERKRLAQVTGCKGLSPLRKLPLHERILNTPVDPMHLIKNVVSHIVNLIAGHEDSRKVRAEEKHLKRFPMSWVPDDFQGNALPSAPFSLSKDDITLADERAKRVIVPHGFDWHPREIFGKAYGMKSHEWKQLATNGILKFCLRGMLGLRQRKTLFELLDVIKCICAECIDTTSISRLEQRIHRVLALLERDFPISLQVIVFHLLHHIPMFLERFGPVYMFWMYPYERFNSWIIRRVLNRRFPESTVVETYRLTEWANFMELSGQLAAGTITDDSNDDCPPTLESKHLTLSDDIIEDLRSHYLAEEPQFSVLMDQYKKEKDRAKVKHRLKHFPNIAEWTPRYGPPLSDDQRKMCCASYDAVNLRHYTYKDCHNRSITVSSSESDSGHSYCCSSYVAHLSGTPNLIGRVVTLFQHTFLSTATFAYVSWFDGPYKDPETNLVYVLASAQTQSVMPVSSLSKPLVIAYDDEEIDKLWILNL